MTVEEVYEKYKHLDTFLEHIHLGMGNSPATIQDQILYDCWQAIKAVATADPQCESQDVEIVRDGEGPWTMTPQERKAKAFDWLEKQVQENEHMQFWKHENYIFFDVSMRTISADFPTLLDAVEKAMEEQL